MFFINCIYYLDKLKIWRENSQIGMAGSIDISIRSRLSNRTQFSTKTMSHSNLFPINLTNLSAKERHNYILNHYVLNSHAEAESRRHKRDIDVIRENHRFLWEDDEEVDTDSLSWEQRLALRYYKKLFKEYCIADLSLYKENKIALRWRTEQEVVTGTGQFQCGSRHCGERSGLRSWEVNFKYIEKGAP